MYLPLVSDGCNLPDFHDVRHLQHFSNYKEDSSALATAASPGDKEGWMDELGFYVPSTVFQSFRDDGRVNMKGSVQ